MQIILFVFVAYLLYRFIVGFVLPVVTAASRIKKQFGDMQANQASANNTSATERSQPESASTRSEKQRTTSGKKAPKEDYIEFEEIPASKNY